MVHLGDFLPKGRTLAAENWVPRHRIILAIIWGHAIGLALFGLYQKWSPGYALAEGGLIALLGAIAAMPTLNARFRSSVAALALVTSSAVFTQFWGGYIEGHFHFFIVLAIIALYEDWTPFLLGVLFVAVDHGLLGTLVPQWVYNHPDAIAHPWKWAGIHATLVLAESTALVGVWKATEQARARSETAEAELATSRRQNAVSEKLAALGTMVSGVGHEVRTPITYVNTNLALIKILMDRVVAGELSHEEAAVEINKLVATSKEGVARVDRIVQQLRLFAKADVKTESVALHEVVAHAVDLFRAVSRGQVSVESDLPRLGGFEVDQGQLQQVLINLLNNGAEAMGHRGTLVVRMRPVPGGAEIDVEDHGPGIPAEVQPRLFDPFFTTKPTGTGLGLSISRRIIEAHGGTLWFKTSPQGTTFTVTLPSARHAKAPEVKT